ncbi:MAG TPA: suppressor of fused domain protein [Hyphomicrobiaceae bacterium]|nr:suppressor of fused domain protein [Hyphomicrobiaceae bacterium]
MKAPRVPEPTELEYALASRLNVAFGRQPDVRLHGNYGGDKFLAVAAFRNEPRRKLVTLTTIGLSNHDFRQGKAKAQARVTEERIEICSIVSERSKKFDLVVSSCAFFIMDGLIKPIPHEVWEEKCGMINGTKWPHVFLCHAAAIDPRFATQEVSGVRINWLFAAMISDSEADLVQTHGGAELESRLVSLGSGRFAINRPRVA